MLFINNKNPIDSLLWKNCSQHILVKFKSYTHIYIYISKGMEIVVKVSVIVPVYNTEKYLEECIQSILNQSLEEIELILVNDCSTDQSLRIMQQFEASDKRVKIIDLPMNVGVGDARNKGIDMAQGEYLAFVDSDDLIVGDMLEKLYEKGKSEHAEIVLCDTQRIPNHLKFNSWFKPIYGKAELKNIYRNTQPSARITARSLIDRINFRFLPGMGESIYFELMIHAEMITTVPEKLYIYRYREDSLSNRPNPEKSRNSMKNSWIMKERNPEYKMYFEFKMILDLLDMMINAIKNDNQKVYFEAIRSLNQMNFKKNQYIKQLYKVHTSPFKYFLILHIFPKHYHVARMIAKLVGYK